ncbi:hypothetical protein [Bradyrhizobium sp.]|uniref:hypothetical protein n=1 Tax=Bradyrhizobium sp. TaxID=376 RepID=UPI001EBB8F3F|nr:hypothetical protein [Bradyrhizobium sp.]MBV9984571.1 hypothetical protein [Bradyrhizobium sp.]
MMARSMVAKLSRLAVLSLVLALAGCVTDQSAPLSAAAPVAVAPGQAVLTISRTSGFYASGVSADIDANGSRIASLGRGETFSGGIRPGPVVLTVSCWSGPGHYVVRFNAEPGKRYAFEVSPRDEQFGVTMVAGMVGVIADSAINSETSGAFKIAAVANGH